MDFFNRLSIRKKILIIPVLGTASLVVFMIMASASVIQSKSVLESVRDHHFPSLQLADKVLIEYERVKEDFSGAVTTSDDELLEQAKVRYEKINAYLSRLVKVDNRFEEQVLPIANQVSRYYDDAFTMSSKMIQDDLDLEAISETMQDLNKNYEQSYQQLATFRAGLENTFQQSIQSANDQASALIVKGTLLGALTICLLFLVSVPIALTIKGNLNKVIQSLKNIAQENGDLTVRLNTSSKDEVGELVYWFNNFIDKLQCVIRSVVDSVSPTTSLVVSLKKIAEEASQGISSQQQGATSTRESVESMGLSVSNVTEHVANAAAAAKTAKKEADSGCDVVNNTVDSINALAGNIQEASDVISRLEADSNSVSMVLDVIKGIAEQTNLLALNAAIEAARAGEQGRGFAVVADEVRSLASRTQESTEEIHKIIEKLQVAARSAVNVMEASTQRANDSVKSAEKAGNRLIAIVEIVTRINEMNMNISELTEHQQEVSRVIIERATNIYNRTVNSSQRTERLNEASIELAEMVTHIEQATKQFKV